jgi:hypothetical protein
LGWKVQKFREFATSYSRFEKIVLSDAWDITFYGTKEDALSKIPDDHVLQAAEKNCYPDLSMAGSIPDRGPWRFVNGGLTAGRPGIILRWLELLESHPLYNPGCLDQWFFNALLAEGSPLCNIDAETMLFFCLFGGYAELEFEKGLPVNTVYGTHPNFCHRNGGWSGDEMFGKYERSLH